MGQQNNHSASSPFQIRDCTLVILSTGIRVQTLREFREGLINVHPDSIYHHFWGRLLQPRFDEPEYSNDFAAWARHGLHEKALAERLSVIDPTEHDDIEGVRTEVLERVEERLDESELIPWSRADQQFYFLKSKLIILDTGVKVQTPGELGKALKNIPSGSIYYHFIEARRRTDQKTDDFSEWLSYRGDEFKELRKQLCALDPFFSSLKTVRGKIVGIFEEYARGGKNE